MKSYLSRRSGRGFTVIELLVVILIIGILATLVLVAYRGITSSATDRSVQSDLDGIDGIETDYGTKNNVAGLAWYSGSGPNSSINFTQSAGNVIDVVINSTDYCIRGYNFNAATYNKISSAAIKESTSGACNSLPASAAAVAGSP